jgi:hypothetical protein
VRGDTRKLRLPEWIREGPRGEDFCCPTVLSPTYYRAQGRTSAVWPWQRGTEWGVFEFRTYQTSSFQSIQTPISPHYPHYRKGCDGLEKYVDSGLEWETASPSLLMRGAGADTSGRQVFHRRCQSMREEPFLITLPLAASAHSPPHLLPHTASTSAETLPTEGAALILAASPGTPTSLAEVSCRTRFRLLLEMCLCWWLWIFRHKIGNRSEYKSDLGIPNWRLNLIRLLSRHLNGPLVRSSLQLLLYVCVLARKTFSPQCYKPVLCKLVVSTT